MSLLRISDVSQHWKPLHDARVDPLVMVSAAWPAIVGKQVAEHSRPLEIRRETLIVATRSQAWSHQLSFMTPQVVAAIARDAPQANVKEVRFRVGRIAPDRPAESNGRQTRHAPQPRLVDRPAPHSLSEAISQFHDDVRAARAAQVANGAAFCRRCGTAIVGRNAGCCVPCLQSESEERDRAVARLLFEAPWLGFAGISALVGGLSERDYGLVRLKLLRRWWETLQRAQRARRLSPDGRERLIASSYVILKSGLDPEHIVPAVVRNLLGDELHDLIYGIAN